MGSGGDLALFETKRAKGRILYRLFAASTFVGILSIWIYRVIHFPSSGEDGRLGWIGIFCAELWFGLYWVLTQSLRWNRIYRHTFKQRLKQRYGNELPGVDIFVCTADPAIEPPIMVVNTVLSVMAYDYPPEKLSVYLSDDAGSELTFYALMEASVFSKHWLPFCRKYKVEPRSPAAYFRSPTQHFDANQTRDLAFIKKLYEEMKNRIETATNLGRISEEIRSELGGFSQWESYSSTRDHDTILQILIDGRTSDVKDVEGCRLPTLVYLAREKRLQHPHNFKAGAMNALIRVSSEISNGQIILNVDCDMYSNSSSSILDVLCFFMDEETGHEIAYVQFPQNFENDTKNEIYSSSLRVISEVEFHGLDGHGGPLYVGTGCFHRRETLCGRKYSKETRIQWKKVNDNKREETVNELEERVKAFASATYEINTQWGNEVGLKYGCPVEDVITGLSIQCQGWKSVYYNPERKGFLGVASTTLDQTLVQHKRWSEGDLQILLSKYSPAWYGLGKIETGLRLGYCTYCLWAPTSLPTLYYSIIPSLYLLRGVSLYPPVSSLWFVPFGYVIVTKYAYSFAEFMWSGGTVLGWWNDQRIWLYKRTSSYLFAFLDTVLKLIGRYNLDFIISTKVTDRDVSERYEKEMMEFGSSSPMFTVLTSIAMINLFCLVGVVMRVVMTDVVGVYEGMALQIVLCLALVLINLPLYWAVFIRVDKGKMPISVTIQSAFLAVFACTFVAFLY